MDLKERMEKYDLSFQYYLPHRIPAIVRIDGRAFHTLTKKMTKPFSQKFATCMDIIAMDLLAEIQNSRFAYLLSDEISLLLIDYNKFDSQQWFGGNLQKMVSVSAAIASASLSLWLKKRAEFDSRVFILPEREVVNYFIWRQRDCARNSIQMVARSLYSHKELEGKSNNKMQEMIFQKGINWNDYPVYWKRGRVVTKDGVDENIPVFSKDRKYIEKFMEIEEE